MPAGLRQRLVGVLCIALAAPPLAFPALAGAAAEPAEPAEPARMRRAEALIQQGLYDEAADLLTGASPRDDPAALALRGRALALARRYLAAEEPLRRAVAGGSRELVTMFYLGSTLWENGKFEEAGEVYAAALAERGRHPALVHQLGRLELWRGRYDEAAKLLAEAVSRAGGDLEMRLDLARALEAAGRPEPALEHCRAVVAAAPTHTGARYSLARLLLAVGEAQEAERQLEAYRLLLERDDEETRVSGRQAARLARGYELLAAGDAEGGLAIFEELDESPEALAALAAALSARGDGAAAVAALERALRLAPERADLVHRLREARLSAAAEPGGSGGAGGPGGR